MSFIVFNSDWLSVIFSISLLMFSLSSSTVLSIIFVTLTLNSLSGRLLNLVSCSSLLKSYLVLSSLHFVWLPVFVFMNQTKQLPFTVLRE